MTPSNHYCTYTVGRTVGRGKAFLLACFRVQAIMLSLYPLQNSEVRVPLLYGQRNAQFPNLSALLKLAAKGPSPSKTVAILSVYILPHSYSHVGSFTSEIKIYMVLRSSI